ncbi:hypothetical protein L9F63_024076 [Diploptera punctata]|uniref:UDP-N-acetylglucosamine transferase subunit ALG13 n=1 Tax=Diploptera punctata TaxID=6984 RepID=A0AAD8E824_DIPPU|nr:hypothetical protein L9F63_024076 [Diploptera punctata]
MASKHVFATVGTTKFDLFISSLSSQKILNILYSQGYRTLTLQIGNGTVEPPTGEVEGIQVDYFRFKDSLAQDMQAADLVMSHAGAGSCLEALEAGKPLIVVINEDLMDNHQMELASRLHQDGHILYTICDELHKTLENMDLRSLKPLPPAQPHTFARFLDALFGFET